MGTLGIDGHHHMLLIGRQQLQQVLGRLLHDALEEDRAIVRLMPALLEVKDLELVRVLALP